MGALHVALGEYDTGWHDPKASLLRAGHIVEKAADRGAELVVLPEMCTTGFTMEAARYAEHEDGASAEALAIMARKAGVHVLAGLATREYRAGHEFFCNSALLFAPDGSLKSHYRKQRLFQNSDEHQTYVPGTKPVIAEVNGVRIGLFICFDLRFPELFRLVSPMVDAFVIVANWPAERRSHWDVLVRTRAIENLCYVAAVNRVGRGGDLFYNGGSVAYGPWGDRLAAAAAMSLGSPGVPVFTIDPAEVSRTRQTYPFLADVRHA